MIVAIVDVLTSFIFIFTNDNLQRANYSYYYLIVARFIFPCSIQPHIFLPTLPCLGRVARSVSLSSFTVLDIVFRITIRLLVSCVIHCNSFTTDYYIKMGICVTV
jgi:hypothetical protein